MLKAFSRQLYRILASLLILFTISFAMIVISLRYWIFPNIAEYRETITASISRAVGQKVGIASIDASWDGLRPHLSLQQVSIQDQNGIPALSFDHIEGTLSWWSLAVGGIRLHSMEIDRPRLTVRRTSGGRIYVGGVWVNQPDTESGFADWIVRQHRIIVRGATLVWLDELRQAPPLELGNVHLRLENRGQRHRFGLRAVPPQDLSLPLDIRGDLKGDSLRHVDSWSGNLYARLDHANIAAWHSWLDLPFQLERGTGGVRVWLKLGEKRLREVTADLQLYDVLARWSPDLPRLEMRHVSGRLGWRELNPGQSFQLTKLAFDLQDGQSFGPASARINLLPARRKNPAEGELEIDGLGLEPLAALADYFPLEESGRSRLRRMQPKGLLQEIKASWSGPWQAPERYSVKGKFSGLGMQAYALAPGKVLPGFSGLSGTLDMNEKGGTTAIQARSLKLDLEGVFDHLLELDALTAQVAWSNRNGQHEVRLANAAFANSHLAGTAFGRYRTVAGGMGDIDLNGQLHRADARHVSHYLPLVVGADTRQWLSQALKAGQSGDVRLRLKGNLEKFPFDDGKSGLFEVTARADHGILEYAPGWPAIEGIRADLLFRGKSMDVFAHSGHTYGMKIDKVHARISDLFHMDEVLLLDGNAQGPTADMLKFIAQSPVNGMIDGFTENMQANGNGKFNLRLNIPLRRVDDMSVAGNYAFQNNRIDPGEGIPPLEQVNGELGFTGSSVSVPAISAQFLGGPATITAMTRQGVVQVYAGGRLSAGGVNKAWGQSWMQYLKGSAKWNGEITLRKKMVDAVFSSNLQGLGSDLPLPLNKKAGESMVLRLERKAASLDRDSIAISLGRVLTVNLERGLQGGVMKVERGAINLGGTTLKPPQSGVWLSGSLPYLDLDHWRSLTGQEQDSGMAPAVDGAILNLSALDVFGKRFNDLRLNAVLRDGAWQAAVESREMNGSINWNRAGAGRLNGRFSTLNVPSAAPPKLSEPSALPEPPESTELPALDIVAENFGVHGKQLGRMELLAAPSGRDWRIEKLKMSTPESVLSMDGVWQDWLQQPRSRVNVVLETSDIGKLLTRVGHPDSVKGGQASLKGQFYWIGSPAEFNYASLSGLMSLEARKGQFLKIDPGIGKLLGVLSLQSLPRRITLDFRDVFSDGFAFDDISASVKVNQGIVSGSDFSMDGPSAKVRMSGEADLMRETQNLHVRVVPLLGDTVSGAATLLGGPVVGLTTLLVQKVLKDPIGQIIAYEYSISGTWDNPVVTKLKKKDGESKSWDGG